MKKMLRTTPQQERAVTTINNILEASKRVLLSEGYEKFTTNRVAAASGFNIGTIYRYFPDKEAIIIRLHQKRQDDAFLFLTTQSRQGAAQNGIDEFFGQLLKKYILSHSNDDHAIAVELTKAAIMNQHIRALEKAHHEQFFDTLYKAVAECFTPPLDRRLIQFFLELGMHLTLMVSMKPEEKRNVITEQAVATMVAAVQIHCFSNPAY